jgi:hypothetical protein
MVLSDELRDYRILFIPAIEALSAVDDGGRLPVAASGTETRRRPCCQADPPGEDQNQQFRGAER